MTVLWKAKIHVKSLRHSKFNYVDYSGDDCFQQQIVVHLPRVPVFHKLQVVHLSFPSFYESPSFAKCRENFICEKGGCLLI